MPIPTCLIVGDINIDFAMHSNAYPPEGGEAHAHHSDLRLGGSGCLTAIALQRLGCPTMLAGNLGEDIFADFALGHIRASGLDCSLLQRLPDQGTGFFMILVTPGGQRTMFGSRGANALPLPEEDLLAALPGLRHLHISGYTLLGEEQYRIIQGLMRAARAAGLSVSLDPGVCTSSQARQIVLDLLPLVDIFLPSLDELALLAPAPTLDEQVASVRALGPAALALKMGARGSRFVDDTRDLSQPAERDEARPVIDTTGAGDCFNAGFLRAWLAGQPPEEALKAGNRAALRIITSPRGILDLIAD